MNKFHLDPFILGTHIFSLIFQISKKTGNATIVYKNDFSFFDLKLHLIHLVFFYLYIQ